MPDILLDPDYDDQQLLARVIDYYHRTLKETTEGLDYLRKRGVTVAEAIDHFRIGYANRTLGLKLPTRDSKAGRNIRSRLQQLGLYRDTGREHLNGCVVFPIPAADGSGQVVDVYGRKTGKHLHKGTPLHMHTSNRGVWNVEAFKAGSEIIVCSSLFDALTFWNCGYRNVTCTFGAITDDHLFAFREFGVRRVLVTATEITPTLLAAGIECFHILLPPDVDVNAYALQTDNPSRALGATIRKAEWIGKRQSVSADMQIDDDVGNLVDDVEEMTDGEQDDLDDDWEELEEADALDDDESVPPIVTEDGGRAKPTDKAIAPVPILDASPLPPAPTEIDANVSGDEVTMHLGHRRYRIRGLSKNLAFDQLKVNVLATTDAGMYVDTFDLYIARHRRQFVIQAATELVSVAERFL